MKEREKARTITAQLERRFASERMLAEAQAKADLDTLRQQSADREARAREEAQRAAEALITEKLTEAERARQDLVAKSNEQVEAAESARKSAERNEELLQTKLNELEQSNAKQIESLRAEAGQREAKIRTDAKMVADLEAAKKVAELESAKQKTEAELQARINEAESARIAVENERTNLVNQIDALRNSNLAEVAKIKEEHAAEAMRIRQNAVEAAELRVRDTIAAQEMAVEAAQAKAREAEQNASEMRQTLASQREVMEKDKEDAVNAERARAFEEKQKLTNKVNEMQRELEKKSADELGEGAEVDVYEALRTEFPEDKITRIAKGTPGADIRQVVMHHGNECGTILYESKNLKKWCPDHVTKLRQDQLAANAEYAVLSTHKFPRDTSQVHNQDGVVIVNPARVVAIATIRRQGLIQIHTLQLSEVDRESKTAALYEFITSEQCTQLLSRIDERAGGLLGLQEKEVRWHENNWKKQGEAVRAIQKSKADLENRISLIIGTSAEHSMSGEEN